MYIIFMDNMISDNIENNDGVFVIFTKTGCKNCKTLKKILELNNYITLMVNCDDYLIDDRDGFIEVMKNQVKNDVERIFFPIVFYDGIYLENPYAFIKVRD